MRDPGPKRGGLGSGVVGDDVVSRKHHGGSRQAVYAVAREELDWWGATLGRELVDGMFGENLTTQGLDVDAAVVGERWRVGSALLEVTGPRIPCATFRAWMGEPGWVRRFTERGRTGAYLAVVERGPGEHGGCRRGARAAGATASPCRRCSGRSPVTTSWPPGCWRRGILGAGRPPLARAPRARRRTTIDP